MVDFSIEAVVHLAKMEPNILNPTFTIDGDVNFFVDGNWMTIIASLSTVRTSDFP